MQINNTSLTGADYLLKVNSKVNLLNIMIPGKLAMDDWHIPFMLLELSSFSKSKAPEKQQYELEAVTEMKDFFMDNDECVMDLFWDAFATEDDYLQALDIMKDQRLF